MLLCKLVLLVFISKHSLISPESHDQDSRDQREEKSFNIINLCSHILPVYIPVRGIEEFPGKLFHYASRIGS